MNITSFFDGYDGSSTEDYLKFKRGSGSIVFSKKYGRIANEFSFDADFGNMDWNGFIIKDEDGSFKELDLDLSLKLNIQENIPDEIATIDYSVKGPINSPVLERL